MTDRRFARERPGLHKIGVPGPKLRISQPVADLLDGPQGGRDKQLCFGQAFQTLDFDPGAKEHFGFDPSDGYVGYILANAVERWVDPTHKIQVRSAHIYGQASFKSRDIGSVSFGSHVAVVSSSDGYNALATGGFVMDQHIAPLHHRDTDPAAVAEALVGTPYLWGGNSGFGIDCSGLVQTALTACGIACPRDSDLQASAFTPVADRTTLVRGDLVFWQGHVGMMLDSTCLIHANAHHMTVAVEPLDQAIHRIGRKEFGAVTGFARPQDFSEGAFS